MESVNVVDLALEINSISTILSSDITKIKSLSSKFDSLKLSDEDYKKLCRLLCIDITCHSHQLNSAIRSFEAMVEIIRFNGGRYEKIR